MPTPFEFHWVFHAESVGQVLRAYFDEEHLAAQDKVAGLMERTIVETTEDDAIKQTTWRVKSTRQLPMFVRALLEGGRLGFLEMQRWRKADDEIDMTVTPQILGGRVQIAGVYKLWQSHDKDIQRQYKGAITANVPLLSGKIERGILEEFTKGVPDMARVTQEWLNR